MLSEMNCFWTASNKLDRERIKNSNNPKHFNLFSLIADLFLSTGETSFLRMKFSI